MSAWGEFGQRPPNKHCDGCNGFGPGWVGDCAGVAEDPRDFGLTADDLRAVADRLYDVGDSRLDPLQDVSARFGMIRSHLRNLADAITGASRD
jgi:hypothetical protein